MILTLENLKDKLGWDDGEVWIVGKGPSLRFHSQTLRSDYKVIALNHACTVVKCDVALFTDYEALHDCLHHLISKSRSDVLMPFVPHIRNVPRNLNVLDLSLKDSNLNLLIRQRRLYSYQSSNTKIDSRLGPTIELKNFSVEPAYQVACILGARTINTLGIDGGNLYSLNVDAIAQQRRLSNGRKSFDSQWRQLRKLEKRHGIEMKSQSSQHKIFVGVSERELLAFKTLEYSIMKATSIPVEVVPLPSVRIKPKHRSNRARTPFSFSRFLIPELMNFHGKAIYMDSDMLVFGDVAELFQFEMKEKAVAVTRQDYVPQKWKNNPYFTTGRQYSVMVLDCSKTSWKISEILRSLDEKKYSYFDLLHSLALQHEDEVIDSVDPSWNMLEKYEPGLTKLLHFTVVPTQPWKDNTHDLFDLWLSVFEEACLNGFISLKLVEQSVKRGHVNKILLESARKCAAQQLKPLNGGNGTPVKIEGSTLADYWYRTCAIVRNMRWRFSRTFT